ncbi:MAG: hypothetical protein ACREQ9_23650 [Candidatus Binatia bacterium]
MTPSHGRLVPVPGAPLALTTHEARSRSLQEGDTRPPAPGWLVCGDDGALYVVQNVFRYD